MRWRRLAVAGGDRLVEGRGALRAYFGARPADRLSHRMMANVLVTVDSPTEARATSYFTTYRVDGTWLLSARTLFLPFGGPTPRHRPSAA